MDLENVNKSRVAKQSPVQEVIETGSVRAKADIQPYPLLWSRPTLHEGGHSQLRPQAYRPMSLPLECQSMYQQSPQRLINQSEQHQPLQQQQWEQRQLFTTLSWQQLHKQQQHLHHHHQQQQQQQQQQYGQVPLPVYQHIQPPPLMYQQMSFMSQQQALLQQVLSQQQQQLWSLQQQLLSQQQQQQNYAHAQGGDTLSAHPCFLPLTVGTAAELARLLDFKNRSDILFDHCLRKKFAETLTLMGQRNGCVRTMIAAERRCGKTTAITWLIQQPEFIAMVNGRQLLPVALDFPQISGPHSKTTFHDFRNSLQRALHRSCTALGHKLQHCPGLAGDTPTKLVDELMSFPAQLGHAGGILLIGDEFESAAVVFEDRAPSFAGWDFVAALKLRLRESTDFILSCGSLIPFSLVIMNNDAIDCGPYETELLSRTEPGPVTLRDTVDIGSFKQQFPDVDVTRPLSLSAGGVTEEHRLKFSDFGGMPGLLFLLAKPCGNPLTELYGGICDTNFLSERLELLKCRPQRSLMGEIRDDLCRLLTRKAAHLLTKELLIALGLMFEVDGRPKFAVRASEIVWLFWLRLEYVAIGNLPSELLKFVEEPKLLGSFVDIIVSQSNVLLDSNLRWTIRGHSHFTEQCTHTITMTTAQPQHLNFSDLLAMKAGSFVPGVLYVDSHQPQQTDVPGADAVAMCCKTRDLYIFRHIVVPVDVAEMQSTFEFFKYCAKLIAIMHGANYESDVKLNTGECSYVIEGQVQRSKLHVVLVAPSDFANREVCQQHSACTMISLPDELRSYCNVIADPLLANSMVMENMAMRHGPALHSRRSQMRGDSTVLDG
eukprot:TRINITY_DN3042_c1_g1_i1.p1 TRINITY_DN3042_c1_g1~~TRINITY_DN3042_c1_g1_i1.p1  ORF type:complete len:828 (-),score=154.16 TRINITY_DN3042_c1_g1_i1:80-2563(-)